MLDHLIEFFARTHLVALHFPIALLIVAATIELFRALTPKLQRDGVAKPFQPSPTATTLFLFGLLACAYTVLSGLVFGYSDGEKVDLHRILGIVTGVLVLLAAFALLAARKPTPGASAKVYLVLLCLSALSVGLTGHFGGDLTHGKGFITRPLVQIFQPQAQPAPLATLNPADLGISQASLDMYLETIQPIFDQLCIECHGEEDAEDDIRLDSIVFVLDPVADMIRRDDPDASELIYRIDLPPGDPDIMPPEDDGEPLNPDQINAIRNWIKSLSE